MSSSSAPAPDGRGLAVRAVGRARPRPAVLRVDLAADAALDADRLCDRAGPRELARPRPAARPRPDLVTIASVTICSQGDASHTAAARRANVRYSNMHGMTVIVCIAQATAALGLTPTAAKHD